MDFMPILTSSKTSKMTNQICETGINVHRLTASFYFQNMYNVTG